MSEEQTAIIEPRGVTTGGLPYPEDTEAVMLGAQAIKALAQAIDARPWCAFVRWAAGTLGSAADANMTGWDLQESNFATGDGLFGFVVPKAGLWRVEAFASFVNAFPAGNPQFSVGVKSMPPAVVSEIQAQSGEQSSTSGRRDYYACGLLRFAAGDTVRPYQNNYAGVSGLTFGGGNPPRGSRFSSRFAAWWFAP